MNEHEFRSIFPNSSPDAVRRNADLPARDRRPPPKLERDAGDGALGKVQVQKGTHRRFLVVVTSVRKFLLDDDNLCEKFHVDLLRYSGVIPGDSPVTTRIQVAERKTRGDEKEQIIIEVYELGTSAGATSTDPAHAASTSAA